MKRFWSWIVLIIHISLARLSLELLSLFSTFYIEHVSADYGIFSVILIVAYVIFLFWLLGVGYLERLPRYIVNTVQSICPSRTGARYIVVAVISSLQTINQYFDNLDANDVLGTVVPPIIAFLLPIVVARIGKKKADEFKEQEFKDKVEEYVRNMK